MSTSIPVRSDGQTIDQSWYNTIRSEVSTLDDRVDALGTNQSIEFVVNGYYGIGGSVDNIIVHKVTQSITATSATLHIVTAGTAGSTKVMLKKKTGAGAYLNMFSTAPIVPFGAGNNSNSDSGTGATAAVLVASTQTLVPGDLVALDLQQSQDGVADTLILTLYHTTDGV